MLTRREFVSSALCAVQTKEAPQPNILFIIADQWRAQTLPSAGDPDLKAPNLAKLAAQGVTFSRTYTANPVCTPARARLSRSAWPNTSSPTAPTM